MDDEWNIDDWDGSDWTEYLCLATTARTKMTKDGHLLKTKNRRTKIAQTTSGIALFLSS